MTDIRDIRWEQRFSNYTKALSRLSEAIAFTKEEVKNKDVIIGGENVEVVLIKIINEYHSAFLKFQEVMEEKKKQDNSRIYLKWINVRIKRYTCC